MRLTKKICAIVFALVLLVSCMSVFTAVAVDYSYTDFRITGFVKQVDRVIYLSTDVAIPGNWGQYVGLDIKYDGKALYYVTNANEGVKNAGTGTTQLVLPLLSNGEWNARQVGTKLEITASTATAKGDADYNGDGRPDAIRLVETFTLIWDGTAWTTDASGTPDTSEYNVLGFNGISTVTRGTSYWSFYLTTSGTIPGAFNGTFANTLQLSFTNGSGETLVDHIDASVLAYSEYAGGTLLFRIPTDSLPFADVASIDTGSVVTFHAGQANSNTEGVNGIEIAKDYMFAYNGSSWDAYVPDVTVYDVLGFNGISTVTRGTSYWSFYLTTNGTIPGAFNGTFANTLQLSFTNGSGVTLVDHIDASVLSYSEYAGGTLLFRIPTDSLPFADVASIDTGSVVTFHTGQAKSNTEGVNGIKIEEDYKFAYNGSSWAAYVPDTTVYTELNMTGVSLAQFKEGSSGNRWEFYVKVDGTIPGVADSAYNFSPFTVTVKNGAGTVLVNKEYAASYAGYDGGTLYFRIPESDLSQNSVDAGTIVTFAAGKAKPDKDCNGINLLTSYAVQYSGTAWAPYVPYSYTDIQILSFVKQENRIIYLNIDAPFPGDWQEYVGLDIRLNGQTLYYITNGNLGVKNAGKGIKQLVLPMLSNGENNALTAGSELIIRAGVATAKNAADYDGDGVADAIRVTKDFKLIYNGSTWTQLGFIGDFSASTTKYDVNNDGAINVLDAVLLKHWLADNGSAALSMTACDINDDDEISAKDQRLLRRNLLGVQIVVVDGVAQGTPYYAGGEMIKAAYVAPEFSVKSNSIFVAKPDDEIRALFEEYKAAGFTHIITENRAKQTTDALDAPSNQALYKCLEIADEVGLKVVAASDPVFGLIFGNLMETSPFNNNWQSLLDSYIAKLQEYDSFWGYYLGDEPDGEELDHYVTVVSYLREKHPDVGLFCANCPNYVNVSQLINANQSVTNYADYVKLLGTTAGHFMYDNYGLYTRTLTSLGTETHYVAQHWFTNLQTVADIAKQYGFTTGVTMQSVALPATADGAYHTNQVRPIRSEADIGFQIYTALAYGMKELDFFTYGDHWSASMLDGTAMKNDDGTLNDSYYYVQNVYADVAKLEAALLNYSWLGTITSGVKVGASATAYSSNYTVADNSRLNAVDVSGSAVIGCMKDTLDGFDGYMIANAAEPVNGSSCIVRLTFNNATKAMVYLADGSVSTVNLTDGQYEATVNVGEGVFVIPMV